MSEEQKYVDDKNKKLFKNKNFWLRVISGVILAALLVVTFVLGGVVMWALLLVISLIGLYEFNKALSLHWGVFAWAGYIVTLLYYALLLPITINGLEYSIFSTIPLIQEPLSFALLLFGFLLVADLAVFVFTYPRYDLSQVFAGFFEVMFIPVAISFLFILRETPPSGAFFVWLAVIAAWGSDIFAYLIGMLFGTTPFVPKLSPKKSIEGAIGGLIGSAILGVVYGFIVQQFVPMVKLAPIVFGVFCFFGSAAGQIGDLAASAIKRKIGIKDYGNIIPGHGGVLDRFDSLIMTAPIVFLITIWINIV